MQLKTNAKPQKLSKKLSRRSALQLGIGAIALAADAGAIAQTAQAKAFGRSAEQLAKDEEFWMQIARAYRLDGRYIVLNGGGNNPIPDSVVDALHRYDELSASQPRPHNYLFLNHIDEHRERLATLFNCGSDELAITRNTTEGLNIVGSGLDFKAGDEIIVSNFEEVYAKPVFEQVAARHGAIVKTIELPLEPTAEEVVARYRDAMTSNTRMLVASHVVDGWGFVLPVKELSELAHANGAQMLVDGALGFGQIPVDVQQIGCDYYATSLHKWLNAPLGTGALFVKRERIEALWPLYGVTTARTDIRKFERIGTRCGPTIAAIGQAIDFYQQIGPTRKAARVKYLSSLARDDLKGVSGVTFLTERDEAKRTGLARIAVTGYDGRSLTTALREEFGIYTFGNFPGEYDGVYISPNVFNSANDMLTFTAAVKQLAT